MKPVCCLWDVSVHLFAHLLLSVWPLAAAMMAARMALHDQTYHIAEHNSRLQCHSDQPQLRRFSIGIPGRPERQREESLKIIKLPECIICATVCHGIIKLRIAPSTWLEYSHIHSVSKLPKHPCRRKKFGKKPKVNEKHEPIEAFLENG